MAEGRLAHDWARTSTVLALLANCHRDPKKTRDLSILKTVFVDNHRKVSPP